MYTTFLAVFVIYFVAQQTNVAGVSDDDAVTALSAAVRRLGQQAELAAWLTDSFRYVVNCTDHVLILIISLMKSKLSNLVTAVTNIPSRIRLRSVNIHHYELLTMPSKFSVCCFSHTGLKTGTLSPRHSGLNKH